MLQETERAVAQRQFELDQAFREYRNALQTAKEALSDEAVKALGRLLRDEQIPWASRIEMAAGMVRNYIDHAFSLGRQYYQHSI